MPGVYNGKRQQQTPCSIGLRYLYDKIRGNIKSVVLTLIITLLQCVDLIPIINMQ